MITRGSKYFIAAAVVAYLAALFYGFITGASAHGGVIAVFTDGALVNSIIGPISFGWKGWVGEHVGYSVLMAFAGSMAVLGGFTSVFRDGSPEALAELQGVTVDQDGLHGPTVDLRVDTPKGLNYWPFVGGFSAAAIIIGLAVSSILFVVGCIGLIIVAVEWTIRTWSEQATADQAENAELRNRLMYPFEVPVASVLVVGAVVFLVSRILLAAPKVASVFIIIGVAIVIFGTAILLASRPHLKRSVLVGVLLVGGAALLVGGIAGGVAGTREPSHGAEHGAAVSVGVVPVDVNGLGVAAERY